MLVSNTRSVLSQHPAPLSLKFRDIFNISVDLPGVANIKYYQLILEEFNENDFYSFFLIVYMGG